MPRTCPATALLVFLAARIAVPLYGQSHDIQRKEYAKRQLQHCVEAAQRYVDIGWWARKVGMVPQATTQFLRAAEVGKHEHQMADVLVGQMRSLGDRFWRSKRKKVPRALLADYERRVAAADRATRQSHVKMAHLALGVDDVPAAREHCRQAMRLGAEIAIDGKGKARLDRLPLPDELASWLQEQTVATAGGTRVYEPAAAAGGPRLAGLHEQRSERLIVRTDVDADLARRLHALASAVLPHLEDRLDGAPARPLVLLVLGKRADYDAYLRSIGIQSAGSGLAAYGNFQTIVCAEGKGEDELHALVLHELSHLFFYGVAPAAMPDWYAEGFAESFGGQGSFTWDGSKLQIGGLMEKDRLDAMRAAPLSLRELLAADAEQLWVSDRARAVSFYTQAWALQRFLRSAAAGRWQQRFADWEAECRGGALGAQAGSGRLGDRAPAQEKFEREFGKELDEIERAFLAWLRAL